MSQEYNSKEVSEFSKEKVKKGILRTLLGYFAAILYVIGFFVSFVNIILGFLIIILGLSILVYSIFQSLKDSSELKWFNIIVKIIVILIGIGFLTSRIYLYLAYHA